MPNWKKLIVSGADASLNVLNVAELTSSAGILVGGDIIPSSHESFDLGSSTNRFKDLYLSGSTIDLGGLQIGKKADGALDVTSNGSTQAKIEAASIVFNRKIFIRDPGDASVEFIDPNNTSTKRNIGAGSLTLSGNITASSFTGSLLSTNGVLSSSAQIASNISGSFDASTIRTYTGSFNGDGTGLTGITAQVTEQVTINDTFTSVSTHSVAHTFATKNLNVTVYDSNDDIFVPTRINTPNTSSVVLYMDPATTGRVVISKGGHIVSGSIATNIVTSSTISDTFTSAATHSVAHTFGTKDVFVTVYDSNDDQFVPTRISTPTTSSVIVYMDPATTGRVVIAKGGHLVSGSQAAAVDFSAVDEHILPATTEIYDLGSTDKRWRDLYLSGSTIDLGGTKITRDAATGDIEFSDRDSGNRRSIKVDELQLGSGASARKIRVNNGRVQFTDTSDNAQNTNAERVIVNDGVFWASGSGFLNNKMAFEGNSAYTRTVFTLNDKEYLRLSDNLYAADEVVFNEGGRNDIGFRVESDTKPYMLYVSPSGNSVHVGSSAGNETFNVTGNISASAYVGKNNLRQAVTIGTSNYTASLYSVNVLSSSLSVAAPASPSAGDWFKISNRSGTTTCVIDRHGSNIMGSAENLTLDTAAASFELVYADATQGWVIIGQ